jgi:hypothetical protein
VTAPTRRPDAPVEGVTVRPDNAWRSRGAPPLQIPPKVVELLEHSYTKNVVMELPAEPDSEDTKQFLSVCRTYARRQGKSFHSQWAEDPETGESILRFKMRAKRGYTTTDAPRDRRR